MSSAFNIPAGYALVPLEPTFAMIHATCDGRTTVRDIYVAMLAAAPPVDAVPGEPVAPLSAEWAEPLWTGEDNQAAIEYRKGWNAALDAMTNAAFKNNLAASVASRAGSEPVRVSVAKDVGYDGVTLIPFTAADDGSRWLHIRHPAGDTNVPIRQHRDGLLWDQLKAMANAPSSRVAPAAAAEPSGEELSIPYQPEPTRIAKTVRHDRAGVASLVAWREHVEKRLWSWRQSFVNKSGDQLTLEDFMDKRSMDDLINYVLDESAEPRSKGDTQ